MKIALLLALALALCAAPLARADCLSSATVEKTFLDALGAKSLPTEGSCCQKDVCGLPCPAEPPKPKVGYVIAVGVAIGIFCLVGFSTYFFVGGKTENFFVAGRSLPLPIVALTLAAQSIDSNALLGNVDLSYKYHFWDGAVLPIGLGLSLIINGIFLARFIHRENVLTLPDIYGRYFGPATEVCVSLICCASFIALLAGNLVGMATILGYLGNIDQTSAIFTSGIVLFIYTISGGLFSVAYTDVVQSVVGICGALVVAFYFIENHPSAPAPSIGFPGYVYPDQATCDLYEGVPCSTDPNNCCYNAAKWCPDHNNNCRADNGAYPFGDLPIFYSEMSDPSGLAPFPNAIFFNWATIFILGFGNLAALDFQARCMASKTEFIATVGCLLAGCITFLTGIPFSYLGAITRVYYGPDSIYASFEADTCSKALGLPTCGLWLPGARARPHARARAPARPCRTRPSANDARTAVRAGPKRRALTRCLPPNLPRLPGLPAARRRECVPAPDDERGAAIHRRLDPRHDRRRLDVDVGRSDPRALDRALAQRCAEAPVRHLRDEPAVGVALCRSAGDNPRVHRRVLHLPNRLPPDCRVRHHARGQHRPAVRRLLCVARRRSRSPAAAAAAAVLAFSSCHPRPCPALLTRPCPPGFLCADMKAPSPFAAFCCVVSGSLLRLILEFTLPKDGFLILPWPGDEFLDYGVPADDRYPAFLDVPEELKWNPNTCKAQRLSDFTGVDSLASPLFSLFVFLVVSLIEKAKGSPIATGWFFTPTPAPESAVKAVDGETLKA